MQAAELFVVDSVVISKNLTPEVDRPESRSAQFTPHALRTCRINANAASDSGSAAKRTVVQCGALARARARMTLALFSSSCAAKHVAQEKTRVSHSCRGHSRDGNALGGQPMCCHAGQLGPLPFRPWSRSPAVLCLRTSVGGCTHRGLPPFPEPPLVPVFAAPLSSQTADGATWLRPS